MKKPIFYEDVASGHRYRVTIAHKSSKVTSAEVKRSAHGIILSHEPGNERMFIAYNHVYDPLALGLEKVVEK